MCHLREFFIVHHLREKEDKTVECVTIPKIQSQQIVLDLSGQGQSHEQLVSHLKLSDSSLLPLFTDFSHHFALD